MSLKKLTYALAIPSLVLMLLNACGATSSSSGPSATNTNNSSGTGTTTALSGTLCPTTNPAFASGSGTQSDPYIITTFCHLNSLATNIANWGSYVRLEANLDLTGLAFTPMIEWSGTFDGNGMTISNFNGQSALFIENHGTIENLNLQNFNMVPLGGSRPGLLVGTNYSGANVTNCTATGSINGLAAAGLDSDNDIYWFVGGLVAINVGNITHSSAKVNVTGLQDIGGLVGHNEGTILTSHADGSVNASTSGSNFGVGGLVGSHMAGTISNSYALGLVQGVSQAGGLVGYNTSTIQDSFSAGAVGGTGTNVGGLVGQNNGGTVANSFWDVNASGQSASSAGTGESTAAMEVASTFTGYDFTNTWTANSGSYPTLR